MAQELLQALREAWRNPMSEQDRDAIIGAIQEIQRLRASQFRWIPMSERRPEPNDADKFGDILVARQEGGAVERRNWENSHCISHWAPIPPLPEKSQEEKDEALLQEWMKRDLASSFAEREKMNTAFKAGLKAARGEKP